MTAGRPRPDTCTQERGLGRTLARGLRAATPPNAGAVDVSVGRYEDVGMRADSTHDTNQPGTNQQGTNQQGTNQQGTNQFRTGQLLGTRRPTWAAPPEPKPLHRSGTDRPPSGAVAPA